MEQIEYRRNEMPEKTKKTVGVLGAIAVAVGTGAMILSGGTVAAAEGIVGLAAAVVAAGLALYNGLKE
jgi:hypothetical protein